MTDDYNFLCWDSFLIWNKLGSKRQETNYVLKRYYEIQVTIILFFSFIYRTWKDESTNLHLYLK